MPKGVDKGYDVFIEVARRLRGLHGDIVFHVVGSFDESDIDVSDLQEGIKFYGVRQTDFFPGFYASMDIIRAPNAPFGICPGSFDAFLTGGVLKPGCVG